MPDISDDKFSTSATINQIDNLINTKGYYYNIILQKDLYKGYVKATINLSLKDKPLSGTDLSRNPNFTKIIYIYNFKVPVSKNTIIMILLSMVFGISIIIVLSVIQEKWIWKKAKYKKFSTNFKYINEKNKKARTFLKRKRYFKSRR